MASEDLEKYYKALDKAILKYHKIKMDEINKTMNELWQETYSGKGEKLLYLCHNQSTETQSHILIKSVCRPSLNKVFIAL